MPISHRARVVLRMRNKAHRMRWLGTRGVRYVGVPRTPALPVPDEGGLTE